MDALNNISSIFGSEKDLFFMGKALSLAQKAYDFNEVPIGALIVNAQGIIIGSGYNVVEKQCTQTAHAEIIALANAGKKNNDWRLEGCWVYVTLEPCAFCMHAILLSRISGVVYAAQSPLFGFHLDNDLSLWLYKKKKLAIVKGVCSKEAEELLKKFFNHMRKKGNPLEA